MGGGGGGAPGTYDAFSLILRVYLLFRWISRLKRNQCRDAEAVWQPIKRNLQSGGFKQGTLCFFFCMLDISENPRA